MQSTLLKDLNKEQQLAVLHTDGPAIILAGAGSGKTRVLTYKVLHLMIDKEIEPESILMITFTNKAATEMKERMQKYLRESSYPTGASVMPWIATFHSMCAKILRIDEKLVDEVAFRIIEGTIKPGDVITPQVKDGKMII